MKVKVSSKFKLSSQLGVYEGKIDPMDHLDSYKNLMMFQGYSEVMCKAFSATLKGSVRSWFKKLSLRTIDSFGYLSRLFVANFMSFKGQEEECLSPHHNSPRRRGELKRLCQAVQLEELVEAKHRRRGRDDHKRKEPDTRLVDYRDEVKCKRSDRDTRRRTNDRHPVIFKLFMEDLCGGCLSSSHKRHATKASERDEEEVYNLPTPMARAHQPITFTNDDLRGFHLPYDDALVISATIANFNIQRILVDNRSSADILFVSAFDKIKIGRDRLHPFHTPLVVLLWEKTRPSRLPSPNDEVSHFNWDKRDGANMGVLRDKVKEITFVDPKEMENTKALEEATPIPIHPDYPDRHVMIETKLNEELRNALVEFLKENYDVLAWSQGDILGIDPQIAVHKQ
ncbi:hypothetical protein Acr_00g0100960 [Actinidia rufa]|uniref:Uncharacterized protein n=1 Tax=Actinidia rufa TaxID=165716 RepID=A0A7J0E018_9ERIC|nr:hypothetical protein Acr_00g0100960 [Actinidia rufa]